MEKEEQEEFLIKKLRQQCSKFGFKLEDLPEEKQEKLKDRVLAISKEGDMKQGAVKQLRKTMAK